MRQPSKYLDDRLVPTPRLPKLLVTVETENVLFPENANFNIIYLTLESMYNVPEMMSSEMTYKACTVLPDFSGVYK